MDRKPEIKLFRSKETIDEIIELQRKIFDNAVVYAETSFNYGDNLKKLDGAVTFIIERTNSLPFIARVIIRKFLSRKRMVDIIETTLQKFSNVFGTGRKVDIKGNEEDGEN